MGLDMYLKRKTEIGYWRKFNALHSFIVKEFNYGVDDCGQVYLYPSEIEQIIEVLKAVDNDHSKAELLLPTQPGFFFGTYEYDEWYFEKVKESIPIFEKALAECKEGIDIVYEASW